MAITMRTVHKKSRTCLNLAGFLTPKKTPNLRGMGSNMLGGIAMASETKRRAMVSASRKLRALGMSTRQAKKYRKQLVRKLHAEKDEASN